MSAPNGGSNGNISPLNPSDPINAVAFARGDGNDSFRILSGRDGIPHRARGTHLYRDNDPEHMQPQPGGQLRCRIYNLSDDTERQSYEADASRIFTMAQQGKAAIRSAQREFNQSSGRWTALLEWIEFFTYDPFAGRSQFHESMAVRRRS